MNNQEKESWLKRLKSRLVHWITIDRINPTANRRRVGQNLILVTIFVFFVFLIHIGVIIGTDERFGVDLSDAAKKVHQVVQIRSARRGAIYDRNGRSIAEDSTTYTIYAIIDHNYQTASGKKLYVQESQFDQVAKILKDKLQMDEAYVKKQLQTEGAYQVYFGTKGKNISNTTMNAINEELEKANIEGVAFSSSPSRLYPNGQFASHLIGLAGLADNEDGSQSLYGQNGIEMTMNDILSGQDGKFISEKDSQGRILPGTDVQDIPVVDGQDVYTTLSIDLQLSLESNMDTFFEKSKPKNANATLMSAKTGEILATTQRPTFNATTKEGMDAKDFSWLSLLYQSNFEPGSTMKVMTLAAAIDNGTFDPNATFYNGNYKIADTEINDWTVNEGKDAEGMTFAQGFSLSSNVGMTMLQQRIGDQKWLNYLQKFKFGYPTRFGMKDEASGSLPEDNQVSIAMTAFGQALNVTQVQMLRSFSAIGNDGTMLEPKFISGIYDPNTQSARIAQPEEVGHPVSASAAQQTREYMINVGTDPAYGTLYSSYVGGRIISVDGYNIAVKSGTAEIGKEDGTGYLTGEFDYTYSVVAMIPAEDPKFIMYMTYQQPEHLNFLDWQLVFNPLLSQAMELDDTLNLSTPSLALSGVPQETSYKPGDLTKLKEGETPGSKADELRRHLVQPIVIGGGSSIVKSSVSAKANLKANQQILLLTDEKDLSVPDFYGWTRENMETFAKWKGLTLTFEGSGTKVRGQSVEVGKSLSKHKKMTITLGD